MKLMIVESPNKVKKIKSILGSGWDVAASVGHIRDLPVKDLGIDMPGYRPLYELSGRGADVVKTLRARAARAESVYLATDPDREGEAIAWHLKEALALKQPHRVSFDAITPEVIRRALEQPRRIDDRLVHAQEARRVLDRLVGYSVSPVLSRQTARRGLSAGRVQSPAVRLVVDREREIQAFVEVRHFGAELLFDKASWRAQWDTAPYLKKTSGSDETPKYILDEALATRAAACRDCRVLASSNRIEKQPPPPPFSTSTLLQAASVRLGWKPDITAGVAQKLFEAGLITYHRTDSQNFSAEALTEVREYATERGLPLPARARSFRSRGGAQEAHEAIRPTHFATETAGEDREQQRLYRLIWERSVASQLADAEWSVNTTRLESHAGEETFTFKAEGRVLVVPGWKALTAKDDADEDEEAKDGGGKVPVLAVGAAIRAEDGRVLHKKTQPPPRYSQAGLIKKLESIGIGRPSTYAAILKNVQTRGYLEDDKKFLRPTELGFVVIDALLKRFSFVEYAFTRDLEQQLDDIAEGKVAYLPVVSAADERLQAEIAALGVVARGSGSSSPGTAWASSGNRTGWSGGRSGAARLATPPVPRPRPDIPSLPDNPPPSRTQTIDATPAKKARAVRAATANAPSLSEKSAAKKTRSTEKRATTKRAASKTVTSKRAASEPAAPTREAAPIPCPVCKSGFVRLLREDSKAWGCSTWAETKCGLTVWRTMAGRELSPSEVKTLCRDGHTGKLGGFQSKAGHPFEASLKLTDDGKVEFVFQPR